MDIIIDTREQKPLSFERFGDDYIENVIVEKLDVGDYRCRYKCGHESKIVFERKSMSDLYGTLGRGNRRFKREVERAHKDRIRLVIAVEGSVKDLLRGLKYSTMKAISVLRTMLTFWIIYGVEHRLFNTREDMERYIYETYIVYGNHLDKIKKLYSSERSQGE